MRPGHSPSFRQFRHPSIHPHIHIMSKVLRYEGHNYFRQRLVLATLSGKVLKIDKIRSNDANPGLRGKFFRDNSIHTLEEATCNNSRRLTHLKYLCYNRF
jgi:hypothetical protein